jgi:hypothetical protein
MLKCETFSEVIVAEYKKVVAGSDPVSNENPKANTK